MLILKPLPTTTKLEFQLPRIVWTHQAFLSLNRRFVRSDNPPSSTTCRWRGWRSTCCSDLGSWWQGDWRREGDWIHLGWNWGMPWNWLKRPDGSPLGMDVDVIDHFVVAKNSHQNSFQEFLLSKLNWTTFQSNGI